MEAQLLRLPWELVLDVMTCCLPPNPTTLIPASDQGTQLLLDFSTVNRAAREFTVRRLQQHCILIDSEDRLRRFVRCLEVWRESAFDLPSVFGSIHTMYLAPFRSIAENVEIAQLVRDLFRYTCRRLKRLFMDLPFDMFPPWHDQLTVGPVLLEGLERLVELEELVCTRNAVQLRVRGADGDSESIVYRWPKLRRLALNRPSCDMYFWECVADMSQLQQVVLVGALGKIQEAADFGKIYAERAGADSTVAIVLVDILKDAVISTEEADNEVVSERSGVQLTSFRIPTPKRNKFLDSKSEWLMGTTAAGELWNIKGRRMKEAPLQLT